MKTNNNIIKITEKYNLLIPYLNERTKRLWSAVEAKTLGRGGISLIANATNHSRTTIAKGIKELESGELLSESNKIRKEGGGRKKAIEKLPEVEKAILELIEPTVRGEPESPLLWTTKSLRKLSDELKTQKYKISHTLIGQILKNNNFSLQANRKTNEGKSHPDRDAQFNYIHKKVCMFQNEKNPIISVDAKKKELIGNFKNNGVEWTKKNKAKKVKVYDFLSDADGKVTPYGVYDIINNKGWVNVGIDKDTSEFAVQTIRNWWYKMGIEIYKNSKKLLITADGGGSNGSRVRLWKKELQNLANEIKLEISVCHFPPGTSKWNKIEHRLFSFITKNWRSKPLTSYEVVVNLIASTKTKAGLEVKCELDRNKYEKGKKISDKELQKLKLIKDDFHGDWNYSIIPS